MELSDLVEGYELLRSTSQLDPLYSETGRTVLLHDDGYVRVYLTKGPDKWEELSRSQLIECISYIEYMLRLEEAGFNLEVVLDGCIWTARYTIGRNPDSQLLRTIAPPNHYDSGERK